MSTSSNSIESGDNNAHVVATTNTHVDEVMSLAPASAPPSSSSTREDSPTTSNKVLDASTNVIADATPASNHKTPAKAIVEKTRPSSPPSPPSPHGHHAPNTTATVASSVKRNGQELPVTPATTPIVAGGNMKRPSPPSSAAAAPTKPAAATSFPQMPVATATPPPPSAGNRPPSTPSSTSSPSPSGYAANAKTSKNAPASYFNAMKFKSPSAAAAVAASGNKPAPPNTPVAQSTSETKQDLVKHNSTPTASTKTLPQTEGGAKQFPRETKLQTTPASTPPSHPPALVQPKHLVQQQQQQDAKIPEDSVAQKAAVKDGDDDIEEVDTRTATIVPSSHRQAVDEDFITEALVYGGSVTMMQQMPAMESSLKKSQKKQHTSHVEATDADADSTDNNFYAADNLMKRQIFVPLVPSMLDQMLKTEGTHQLMNGILDAIATAGSHPASGGIDEEEAEDDEASNETSPWESLLLMHSAALSLAEKLVEKVRALKRESRRNKRAVNHVDFAKNGTLSREWRELCENVKDSTKQYRALTAEDESIRKACLGTDGVWTQVQQLMNGDQLTTRNNFKSTLYALSHLVDALHVCCAVCAEMMKRGDEDDAASSEEGVEDEEEDGEEEEWDSEEDEEYDESFEEDGEGDDDKSFDEEVDDGGDSFDDDEDEEDDEDESFDEEDGEDDDDVDSVSVSDASDASDDLSSVDETEPFANVDAECWRADVALRREFELIQRETRFLKSQLDMYRTMQKLKRSFTDAEREQMKQNLTYQTQVLKEATMVFEEKRDAYVQQQYTVDELERLVRTRQRLFQKHWPLLKHNSALLSVFEEVDKTFNEQQREHAERQQALRQTIHAQRAQEDSTRVRESEKTSKAQRLRRAQEELDPAEQAALAHLNQYLETVEGELDDAAWLNNAASSSSQPQKKSKAKTSTTKSSSAATTTTSSSYTPGKRIPNLLKTPRQMRS